MNFKPFGTLINKFIRKENNTRYFEIYKVSTTDKGFLDSKMHDSLQAMFYFFIESCSYIDPSDEWSYIIIYEKKTVKTGVLYETVAYSTLYEESKSYNQYSARISQVLVLPSH